MSHSVPHLNTSYTKYECLQTLLISTDFLKKQGASTSCCDTYTGEVSTFYILLCECFLATRACPTQEFSFVSSSELRLHALLLRRSCWTVGCTPDVVIYSMSRLQPGPILHVHQHHSLVKKTGKQYWASALSWGEIFWKHTVWGIDIPVTWTRKVWRHENLSVVVL